MLKWIAVIVQQGGVGGVGLLMLIENLIPIIPSELIMPLAGYHAASGALDPVLVVLAGTAGSIAGGAAWFALGRALGPDRIMSWAERYGRWLTITPHDVQRGQRWIERWGAPSVCLGRTLPVVRGVICIPAGVARMAWTPFLLWSSLGALIWTSLLTASGYLLRANYAAVEYWLSPVTNGLIILCVAAYVVRLVRFGRRSRAENADEG